MKNIIIGANEHKRLEVLLENHDRVYEKLTKKINEFPKLGISDIYRIFARPMKYSLEDVFNLSVLNAYNVIYNLYLYDSFVVEKLVDNEKKEKINDHISLITSEKYEEQQIFEIYLSKLKMPKELILPETNESKMIKFNLFDHNIIFSNINYSVFAEKATESKIANYCINLSTIITYYADKQCKFYSKNNNEKIFHHFDYPVIETKF